MKEDHYQGTAKATQDFHEVVRLATVAQEEIRDDQYAQCSLEHLLKQQARNDDYTRGYLGTLLHLVYRSPDAQYARMMLELRHTAKAFKTLDEDAYSQFHRLFMDKGF